MMSRLKRYTILGVMSATLLMAGCEFMPLEPDFSGDLESGGEGDIPSYGVKPTVPLKRRPIVPTNKLPRPRIVEHIGWTAAGTLSVALTDDSPMVVTLIESDGTMRGYVAEGRGVEIGDVPTEAFEVCIEVDDERYSVVVE